MHLSPPAYVDHHRNKLSEYISGITSNTLVANRFEQLAVQRFLNHKSKYHGIVTLLHYNMTTVIQVDNAEARQLIEAYTNLYCAPDAIEFVQDGAGNYVMSKENLSNEKYLNPDQQQLQQFLAANNVLQPFTSIIDVIAVYGVEIEYAPFELIEE
jgi:hypothetical protein